MNGLTFDFKLSWCIYRWSKIRPIDRLNTRGCCDIMILLTQTWWQFLNDGDIIKILVTSYWHIFGLPMLKIGISPNYKATTPRFSINERLPFSTMQIAADELLQQNFYLTLISMLSLSRRSKIDTHKLSIHFLDHWVSSNLTSIYFETM